MLLYILIVLTAQIIYLHFLSIAVRLCCFGTKYGRESITNYADVLRVPSLVDSELLPLRLNLNLHKFNHTIDIWIVVH
jgi:hypothetical protein